MLIKGRKTKYETIHQNLEDVKKQYPDIDTDICKENGYEIKVFNINDITDSSSFNPFKNIAICYLKELPALTKYEDACKKETIDSIFSTPYEKANDSLKSILVTADAKEYVIKGLCDIYNEYYRKNNKFPTIIDDVLN